MTARGVDVSRAIDRVTLVDPRDDPELGTRASKQLLGDRTRGDAPDGLARATRARRPPRADAVLRVVRVVGVARPIRVRHVLVGLGARVLVADQHRRSACPACGSVLVDAR